ncbi:MAG: phosphoglucosamine mutase [Candidatus Micrarchaeota archaeon]|nr:phosphoglucosamine mutase [Candidatus Micrarchaeota archaeon]
MFGTSGIRGIYGKEVGAELAMKVGNAAGSKNQKIVLAQDTRKTSPILAECFAAGAMQAGCSVIDIGVCPTPMLAYASMVEGCDGAMITASHNPPEYNGIKLFSKGMEYSRQQEKEIESLVASGEKRAEWKDCGQKAAKDFASEYLEYLLSKADAKTIRQKSPKVLVDAGNAAAYRIAPMLFEAAGCRVVRHLCDEPGNFRRNLEPNPSTLSQTAKAVVEHGCDFGVAFDGDGDRAIAIDEAGNTLPLDTQLSIFCEHFIKKSGKQSPKVVTTVEASLAVREAVERLGGRMCITPVGSLHVAEEVRRQQAVFGGEPCGEYVYPFATPCAEGMLSALFIAEIFCEYGRLSALASKAKTSFMERRKYKCPPESKAGIMQAIAQRPQLEGRLSAVDGIRYDFADGWMLIRPSGTEPAIRLTCEAKSPKRLAEIVQRAEKMIMDAISSAAN